MAILHSQTWAYLRIMSGTLLGGALGFYVMDRVEKSYKEKMNEKLKIYEMELMRKEQIGSQPEESL